LLASNWLKRYSSLCWWYIYKCEKGGLGCTVPRAEIQLKVSRLTPASQESTQLTYPTRMEGWVDLVVGYIPRWLTCHPSK